MRQFVFFFFAITFLCSTSYSQNPEMESNTESWYTYWGVGYSKVIYPHELQVIIDSFNDQDGTRHTPVALDMFGFYWHITGNTIAGVNINGVGDRFAKAGSWSQINQYIYGVSFMHFPGNVFGSGLFARTDFGLVKLVIQESNGKTTVSNSGLGVLAGGGWSFDLGGTRILLNINYAFRAVESESYNTFGFSVGGLF